MARKRVLITGGCGFVGRHLLARLSQEDIESIWIVDNLSTGKPPSTWEQPLAHRFHPSDGTFELEGSATPIKFIQADFLAIALAELGMTPQIGLPKLPQFDEVYHLASVVDHLVRCMMKRVAPVAQRVGQSCVQNRASCGHSPCIVLSR